MTISTPGVEPGERDEARYMARRLNEFAARIVSNYPGKFGFYASLTCPMSRVQSQRQPTHSTN